VIFTSQGKERKLDGADEIKNNNALSKYFWQAT
jgi:hypothetical protein